MKAVETKSSPEAEIRALIDDWSHAVSNKDADALLEHYAEDVIAYDVPPPLQVKGRAAMRRNIEDWLKMFEGSINVEFKDQNLTTSDELAVLHHLARITDEAKGRNPVHGSGLRFVIKSSTEGGWSRTNTLPFPSGRTTNEKTT